MIGKFRCEEYVQVFDENEKGRDFVIGDIHGNKKGFETALDSVSFDKSKDRLFCTGDLIDGGKDSLFIISQLDTEWFFAVRGNHEQLLISSIKTRRIFELVNAIGQHKSSGGKWFHKLSSKKTQAMIADKLDDLPYSITLKTTEGDVGLVHGEVPKWVKDWQEFTSLLKGDFVEMSELEKINETRSQSIWGRTAITDKFNYFSGEYIEKDYQIKRSVKGIDATVHGHTGVYEPVVCGNQVWIDTGHQTKELTILEVSQIMDMVKNG